MLMLNKDKLDESGARLAYSPQTLHGLERSLGIKV
jgi:hypothetical protein